MHSRGGVGRSAGGGFSLPDAATARPAGATQPAVPATGLDALLALQSIDDPLLKKKKAVRRGTALLDALDAIKADLLAGQVPEGRLNQLLALVSAARERDVPELDGLLDDIELRARVELAKFGRYAGA